MFYCQKPGKLKTLYCLHILSLRRKKNDFLFLSQFHVYSLHSKTLRWSLEFEVKCCNVTAFTVLCTHSTQYQLAVRRVYCFYSKAVTKAFKIQGRLSGRRFLCFCTQCLASCQTTRLTGSLTDCVFKTWQVHAASTACTPPRNMGRVEFAESLCSFVRSTRWLVRRLMQMDSVIPELLTSFFAVTEICHDAHVAKEFEVILTYLRVAESCYNETGQGRMELGCDC